MTTNETRTQQDHIVTTEYFNSSDATKATCTCGWFDRWPGNDESAERAGDMHRWYASRKAADA